VVPAGLAALLLVRGAPVAVAFRRQLPGREVHALALYAATSLPMVVVVVVTTTGVANGHLGAGTAAGLVGAAMLSVLAFPTAAERRRLRSPAATGRPE
jgi:Flp pilus assembly protein TadB